MRLSWLERSLLIVYFGAVSGSVFLASNEPNPLLADLRSVVELAPAIGRLIEISEFPGKTIAWAISSIALAPLLLIFSISRITRQFGNAEDKAGLVPVRNGALILSAFLIPWIFLTSYRSDMPRGGAWISALGKYEFWLACFGSALSLFYGVVFCVALVTTVSVIRARQK